MVLKSVFYGTGKTRNIFYCSGICNFGLIIPYWILTKLNIITASFESMMGLFVIVFAADLAIALYLATKLMKTLDSETTAAPLQIHPQNRQIQ